MTYAGQALLTPLLLRRGLLVPAWPRLLGRVFGRLLARPWRVPSWPPASPWPPLGGLGLGRPAWSRRCRASARARSAFAAAGSSATSLAPGERPLLDHAPRQTRGCRRPRPRGTASPPPWACSGRSGTRSACAPSVRTRTFRPRRPPRRAAPPAARSWARRTRALDDDQRALPGPRVERRSSGPAAHLLRDVGAVVARASGRTRCRRPASGAPGSSPGAPAGALLCHGFWLPPETKLRVLVVWVP